MLGVPLWAYVVGASAAYLARVEARRRGLLDALERERRAEQTFRRRHGYRRLQPTSVIDRDAFVELWLLRTGVVDEETMRKLDAEFDALRAAGQPTLGMLTSRLMELQLEELGSSSE